MASAITVKPVEQLPASLESITEPNGSPLPVQLSNSSLAIAAGRSITPVDHMLESVTAVRDRDSENFLSYRVRIIDISAAEKTIYHLRTPADEAALLQELHTQLHSKHVSLKLEGESEGWFNARLAKALGAICDIEKTNFIMPDFDEDFEDDHDEKENKGPLTAFTPCQECFDLSPKIKGKQNSADGTEIVTYENGVIERISAKTERSGLYRQGERRFPKGIIEQGRFFYCASRKTLNSLEMGMRQHEGVCTYRNPKLIDNNKNAQVVFGIVSIGGLQRLVPLQRISPTDFVLFKGTLVEGLLQAAQDLDSRGIIQTMLTSKESSIDPRDFFTTLLKPNKEGTPLLFTLSHATLEEVLLLACQMEIPIDLQTVDPVSKNTLFNQWVGKGHTSLTQLMLEMDPRVIQGVQRLARPLFADALLQRNEEEMEIILAAMSKAGIKLQEPDEWICRAYKGDTDFPDEAFRKLTPQLQTLLYTLANIYCREAFVGRLNGLGLAAKEPFIYPRHIIGPTMNVIDIRRAIGAFLQNMRSQGLLLTTEEFANLDPSKFHRKAFGKIDRILGRDFIEQIAKAKNCPHIGAPRKMLVVNDRQPIRIRVDSQQNIHLENAYTLYADKVPDTNRKLTRDQMTQFLTVLDAIGYNDLARNFHVTADDVQIIDSENNAFSGMPGLVGRLDVLYSVMNPEDHTWLGETIAARVAEQDKGEKAMIRELTRQDKIYEAEATKFGFAHTRTFSFDIFT